MKPRPHTALNVNVGALASELRAGIEGEVRFDAGSRALYASDASNYRQVPIGVVIPRTIEDMIATVSACRRYGAPLLSRGGGTSLCGQCCNVAVLMDMSKYLRQILALDPDRRLARVEPGAVLDDLRHAAERHRLTFAPDPATHTHNTLGGMLGNNSCGPHSVMGGRTSDNVEELDVLTYDGLRLRVGATSDEDLNRIVGEGGAAGAGRSTEDLNSCVTATQIRYGSASRRSRAGSRAMPSMSSCPRTASTSRAPWWAPKASAW